MTGVPAGRLVLVATPIGNLGDLSDRARQTLATADVVACEDTRRTGLLFQRMGVERPRLITVNDHTEVAKTGEILGLLDAGQTVAVITDAGTPGISDPGERLVAAAIAAGHEVSMVPGASAAIAALVTSGLPAGRFVFEGFLPRKGSGRTQRLAALATEERTIVVYEAPHRLHQTLADLAGTLGAERSVAVARELTKLHEEIWRGTLAEAAATLEPRGEYVLVIAGAPETPPADDDDVVAALSARRGAGDDRKSAIAAVTAALGVPKRRVYDLAQTLDFRR
ncbi:MAG: 16S rRNA (cytidine(1402)-2'-O)-methyltransferase [Acidimicrobiia bacterium]